MHATAPLHLAPSQALSAALPALTDLSDWIANTADPAAPPDENREPWGERIDLPPESGS